MAYARFNGCFQGFHPANVFKLFFNYGLLLTDSCEDKISEAPVEQHQGTVIIYNQPFAHSAGLN